MNLRTVLLTSVFFTSMGLIAPSESLGVDLVSQLGDVADITTGVLGKLGYDCQTASVGGIICKKCTVKDNSQKCEAFLCDAVTKKCRKKSAELPNLPNLGNDSEDDSSRGVELPSLEKKRL